MVIAKIEFIKCGVFLFMKISFISLILRVKTFLYI
jgi:hypothetical protein